MSGDIKLNEPQSKDPFWICTTPIDGAIFYPPKDSSDVILSARITSVGKDALSSVARFFGFTPTVAWMIGGITFLTLCSAGIVCPPLGIGLLTTLFALSSVGVIGANWKAVT